MIPSENLWKRIGRESYELALQDHSVGLLEEPAVGYHLFDCYLPISSRDWTRRQNHQEGHRLFCAY